MPDDGARNGTAGTAAPGAPRPGRRPATTRDELTHLALELFAAKGFDATTVDDIAAAAGIGRRTFFRYFASKNDLPWGDFDERLEDMRKHFARIPDGTPLMEAVRIATIEFNRMPPAEVRYHRERMALLLRVPTLLAHSTLRFAAWRQVVAEFAGHRLGLPEGDLQPQAIAWAALGIALSAYEQWLDHEDSDLSELLDRSLCMLNSGFSSR
ncbi:MAG TPA: mycofactocin system transcriptional regulator [Actinophytocola sp.]|uniref:mycofactocin system transcriptional regulator n=1 Tax=Actinophytocola sp. TaxID=1872138 RepID=UPI002F956B00